MINEEQPADAGAKAQDLLKDIVSSASDGVKQGNRDAQAAVLKALPEIKNALNRTVYAAGYWVSFGLVYSGELAVQLMPENGALRRGTQDGAQSAREIFEQRRQAAAASAAAMSVEPAEPLSEVEPAAPADPMPEVAPA